MGFWWGGSGLGAALFCFDFFLLLSFLPRPLLCCWFDIAILFSYPMILSSLALLYSDARPAQRYENLITRLCFSDGSNVHYVIGVLPRVFLMPLPEP